MALLFEQPQLISMSRFAPPKADRAFPRNYLAPHLYCDRLRMLMAQYPMPGVNIEVRLDLCGFKETIPGTGFTEKISPSDYRIWLAPGKRFSAEEGYLLMREYLCIRQERNRMSLEPQYRDPQAGKLVAEAKLLADTYMAEKEIKRRFGVKLDPVIGEVIDRVVIENFLRADGMDIFSIFMRALTARAICRLHPALSKSVSFRIFEEGINFDRVGLIISSLDLLSSSDPFVYRRVVSDICRYLSGSGVNFTGFTARLADEANASAAVESLRSDFGPIAALFRRSLEMREGVTGTEANSK
ncbi:MAG TPA: hypothetical protein VMD02_00550 [Candidatus Omnitrophota bacterium]|nr:hypothetical protein [Candidatus Omnitrophota bacterium]